MHIEYEHTINGENANEHEPTHTHEHAHSPDNIHGESSSYKHTHSPMEELLALMKYMADHNAAHAMELKGLAEQLKQNGKEESYSQVFLAVEDFDKCNARLDNVLKMFAEE